ncbi:hypothetical protein GCM10011586_29110 [Silvibacterium dinghuense]|nr:hypothetical protein GCM10011586_29110 [Silvibacterium dinghuense]
MVFFKPLQHADVRKSKRPAALKCKPDDGTSGGRNEGKQMEIDRRVSRLNLGAIDVGCGTGFAGVGIRSWLRRQIGLLRERGVGLGL